MESRGAAHGDIVISYRSTESGQRGWDSGGYISQNGGDGMANKFEYKVVDVNTIRDIEPVLNRPGGGKGGRWSLTLSLARPYTP